MSLEWATQVVATAPGGHLEVKRAGEAGRRRLVIQSSSAVPGATLLEIPERLGPALRDVLIAMYPREPHE